MKSIPTSFFLDKIWNIYTTFEIST